MGTNPFLGILLHAVGGLAAASFYIPFKRVRGWSWETYWLVGGASSWIVAPWVVAVLKVPSVLTVLAEAPTTSLLWCYLFGVLWGIGGLTFGLSMRYLGMSLGYTLALGFCAAFGTLMPPLARGQLGDIIGSSSGLVTLVGVAVCLAGIAVCGRAGVAKEAELSDEEKKETVREFNFVKGVWVAMFAGMMSACMAFAIAAGGPIAELAEKYGTEPLWRNTPVFIVAFAGGFTTNFVWCMALNVRNHSLGDYVKWSETPLLANYVFSAIAGTTWYLQFMFYGMGTTQMGRYDFSSWTIHMAFIIIFGNMWGIYFHEWRGVGRRTMAMIILGVSVLILSTIVIGAGNWWAGSVPKKDSTSTEVRDETSGVISPGYRSEGI